MSQHHLYEANINSNFKGLPQDAYLLHALNTLPADRDFILHVESTLLNSLFKHGKYHETLNGLNSYFRMLVHRVTRYYRLERMADKAMRSVTVFRPNGNYVKPLVRLLELVEPEAIEPPTEKKIQITKTAPFPVQKMTIMKRLSPIQDNHMRISASSIPAKSLEERAKEYETVRARIFENLKEEEDDTLMREEIEMPTNDDNTNDLDHSMEESSQALHSDIVHFQGWQDIDAIKPFIPSKQAVRTVVGHPNGEEFDFASIWVPQHIFVIFNLPTDEDALRGIKSRCKKNHCKLHAEAGSDIGLLIFNYVVAETSQYVSELMGLLCTRWCPFYLPEPPETS